MPERPAAKSLPLTDGRAARSHRTRLAIVDALLRLLEGGDLRPTTERIAAAASVSTRSIFLHFDDVDSLFNEAVDRYAERVFGRTRPIPVDVPLAERVQLFARKRARICESMGAVARAAYLQEPFSAGVQMRLRTLRSGLRREVEELFASELGTLPPEDRLEQIEALTAVAGWTHWDSLRSQQGLSRGRASAVLERTLTALLVPAPSP